MKKRPSTIIGGAIFTDTSHKFFSLVLYRTVPFIRIRILGNIFPRIGGLLAVQRQILTPKLRKRDHFTQETVSYKGHCTVSKEMFP
jgi:hypothetical protein